MRGQMQNARRIHLAQLCFSGVFAEIQMSLPA